MKNFFYISLFVLGSFISFGQGSPSINILNAPTKVFPGSHFNIIFEINNSIKFQDTINVSLGLPNGWQTLFSKLPQRVIGEDKVKYIYTLSTSKFSQSGNFRIYINAFNSSNFRIEKVIPIQLVKIRNVEITPILVPEYIKESDTLKIDYLVQNLGNIRDSLKIESLNGQVEGKNDSLFLNPNETKKITTTQVIKVSENNSWALSYGIKAYLKDSANPIQVIKTIQVYSTKIKKNDPYLRFPIEVGVWYTNYKLGNKNSNGVQYDIRGQGYLDFSRKHFLDFTIHGPNNFKIPILGSYDIYSVNYNYMNRAAIKAGDYTLQFTNLMEFGRFGRGLRVDNQFKKIGVTAFYIQPRFFNEQKSTFGGSIFLKPNPKLRISVDYMSKYFTKTNRTFWSNLIGVSSKFQGEKITWETELVGNEANAKYDFGVFNRIGFQFKKIQFNSDYIYTGKNFYGFYNNSYLFVNSLSYYVSKKISIGVGNNITRINPSLDAINFNTSPYNTSIIAFANYQINSSNRLLISYNQQEREDRLEPKTFHFKQNFTRLSYNLNKQKFILWYEGRYGTSENLLIPTDANIPRTSIVNAIQPQVRILPWIWVGALTEHQRTSRFSANNSIKNLYFYGGNLRVHVSNKFNATFIYRNNYAPDELIENRSLVDLSANLHLKNHTFNLSGGKAFIPNLPSNLQNTLYFVLKYTYRINTPIAKNKNLGNIKGQVLGLSEGIKKGGIIIQLGEKKSMTDSNGNFFFNKLIPDRYYLGIDKSSLPLGVISSIKLPIEVNVKSDSSKITQITLTKTGGIEGKVFFEKSNKIGSDYNEKPIVIIKLTNDKENFITQVGKNNEFSFKEMKPGNWQLLATIPGNQDKFTIDNAEQSIKIAIDTIKNVELTVKPIERKIYFSSNNFNLTAKNDIKPKKDEPTKVADDKQLKPIIKPKADSLKATSDVKNIKQIDKPKAIKTVQNQTKKTFDGIKVSYIKTPKIKVVSIAPQMMQHLKSIIIELPKDAIRTTQNSIEIPFQTENSVQANVQADSPNDELRKEKDKQ